MSVREKLNENKTGVGVGAVVLIIGALIYGYYYWNSGKVHFNAAQAYFSDDDGQSYYTDSVLNFPPYTHNGKTAYGAAVAKANGHYFVGYLTRFTPETQKQLQHIYDNAVKNNLPVQRTVLDFMGTYTVSGGTEIKLPGPGHNWVPRGMLPSLGVKAPSGDDPEGYIQP